MDIYINNEQDKVDAVGLDNIVKQVLEIGLKLIGAEHDIEVSLTFTDNEFMRKLNSQYRNINETTDVLSFPLEEGFEFGQIAGCPRVLGDIVISLQRAEEQSIEYRHSLAREVCYLAAHGLLHLLGYDHQTKQDKQQMRLIEEQIMSRLNLVREREEIE